ncbi:dual specificity protein phosphatase 10 [Plakobranchus ocellatus]|uniref:protein-tyrosine-phosphatase n=1 Tax=Plakobranchus ocellatus TaxID=259542 RepID=A0AAV3Z3Y9_9GAST|nr:dual specificity protein phosphatase 10 [Plakobranchus ocellatus]
MLGFDSLGKLRGWLAKSGEARARALVASPCLLVSCRTFPCPQCLATGLARRTTATPWGLCRLSFDSGLRRCGGYHGQMVMVFVTDIPSCVDTARRRDKVKIIANLSKSRLSSPLSLPAPTSPSSSSSPASSPSSASLSPLQLSPLYQDSSRSSSPSFFSSSTPSPSPSPSPSSTSSLDAISRAIDDIVNGNRGALKLAATSGSRRKCPMPEAGGVSVLAAAAAPGLLPHQHSPTNSRLASTWNARRHLKLNLNLAQQYNSASLRKASSAGGAAGVCEHLSRRLSDSSNSSTSSAPAVSSLGQPRLLAVTAEEAHMTSKRSKLEFSPLDFSSTPASSLPGNPNHQKHTSNHHSGATVNGCSGNGKGSVSPVGHTSHQSDLLHYHQTFSIATSSASSAQLTASYAAAYSSTHTSSPSTKHSITHTNSRSPVTSPTTAFVSSCTKGGLSPLSSPVVSSCGCGLVCSSISSCSQPAAAASPAHSIASTRPPQPDEAPSPTPSSVVTTSSKACVLAKLKPIAADDLASLMAGVKHRPLLVIDVRSTKAFQRDHVQGALNLCCTDRFARRRLQHGRSSVLDVLAASSREESSHSSSSSSLSPSSMRRLPAGSLDIVVYDDHTSVRDLAGPPEQGDQGAGLRAVLSSLLREGRDVHVLDGGFKSFSLEQESLCCGNGKSEEISQQQQQQAMLYSPTNGYPEPEIEAATASQVLPFLYLGNERDAKDLARLKNLNIGYVLNVTAHVPQYYDALGIRYKRIPASDSAQQNLKQYFEEAIEYIDIAIAKCDLAFRLPDTGCVLRGTDGIWSKGGKALGMENILSAVTKVYQAEVDGQTF